MKKHLCKAILLCTAMVFAIAFFTGCERQQQTPETDPNLVVARIGELDVTYQEYRFYSLSKQAYLDENFPGWREQPDADQRLRDEVESLILSDFVFLALVSEFNIVLTTSENLALNRFINSVESSKNTEYGSGGFNRFLQETFMTPTVFRKQVTIEYFYQPRVRAHIENLDNELIVYSQELALAWGEEHSDVINEFSAAHTRVKYIAVEINEIFMPLEEAYSILRVKRDRLLETESIEEKDALFTEFMIERGIDPRLAEIGTYFVPGNFYVDFIDPIIDELAVGEVSEVYLQPEDMHMYLILRLDSQPEGIASLLYTFILTEEFLNTAVQELPQIHWVLEE